MSARHCDHTTTVAHRTVQCEREHGHGGSHRAEINDYDEDFTYVISWWPTPKPYARGAA